MGFRDSDRQIPIYAESFASNLFCLTHIYHAKSRIGIVPMRDFAFIR